MQNKLIVGIFIINKTQWICAACRFGADAVLAEEFLMRARYDLFGCEILYFVPSSRDFAKNGGY